MSKILFVFLSVCVWSLQASASVSDAEYKDARLNGAKVNLILCVIGDDGKPVEGADVNVILGMNFRPKANLINGVTTKNGEFLVEGKTTGNEIEIFVSKPGYYESRKKLCLIDRPGAYQVISGKWQPWGEMHNILLRKICNPVLQDNILKSLRVPQTNEWIGVDLKAADWIRPYGKGECPDFEMRVFWDGLPPSQSILCRYEIRVCGTGNGFYISRKVQDSYYTEVYRADEGNEFAMQTMENSYKGETRSEDFWKQYEAIFRVRTAVDTEGKVMSANYAALRHCFISPGTKGRGALIEFRRVFNPQLNDTNLEPKLNRRR